MLRAHRLNSKNLFCSCFNDAGYLFILFPFMVEIFVCFPCRTSSPFQSESLYVQVQFQFLYIYLYLIHHIIYLVSFSHHIVYLCTFRLSSIFLLQKPFYSISLYVCTFENLDFVLKQMHNFSQLK